MLRNLHLCRALARAYFMKELELFGHEEAIGGHPLS
jgi:hypothetical protein